MSPTHPLRLIRNTLVRPLCQADKSLPFHPLHEKNRFSPQVFRSMKASRYCNKTTKEKQVSLKNNNALKLMNQNNRSDGFCFRVIPKWRHVCFKIPVESPTFLWYALYHIIFKSPVSVTSYLNDRDPFSKNNKRCFQRPGLNFINMFTRRFYASRSRKHKKLLNLTVFLVLSESCARKSCT